MEAHTRTEEKSCLDGSSIIADGVRERGVREEKSIKFVLLLLEEEEGMRREDDDWRRGREYVINTPSLDIVREMKRIVV